MVNLPGGYKGYKQATVSIVSTLVIHFVFRYNDWVGANGIFLISAVLLSALSLIDCVKKLYQRKWTLSIGSLFLALLILLIFSKIQWTYFNFFVALIASLVGFLMVFKRSYSDQLNERIFVASGILLVLTIVPIRWIVTYLHKYEVPYHRTVILGDFTGPVDTLSEYTAVIDVKTSYKVNQVFNYPQFMAINMMDPRKSWVKEFDKTELNVRVLTEHEQIHFDIHEMFTMNLTDSVRTEWSRKPSQIDSIAKYFTHLQDSAHISFDHLTKHGKDTIWQSRIRDSVRVVISEAPRVKKITRPI